MKRITLTPLQHGEELQIGIRFSFDREVQEHLQKLGGVKWSDTHKSFYMAFTQDNKSRLFRHLNEKKWFVDYSKLQNPPELKIKEKAVEKPVFNREQKKLLHEYVFYLRGKRYSESSVRTYYNFIYKFVDYQGSKPLVEFKLRDVEKFFEKLTAAGNFSISTHRQCVSALNHLAGLYPEFRTGIENIKRPKKSNFLPTVISKEEVIDLLRGTRNLKHRTILALIYSSGLRIGELLDLKLKDIDVDRRQILIKQGKGRKDRNVIMAESFVPLLFNYITTYQPKFFFIEGINGQAYSSSSIRSFLKISCRQAKLKKRVTPHTLRHSFATHLLQNGIGLRYIQELLGHSKPETTMIYTHVAQKDLLQIKSPLDATFEALNRTNKEGKNLRLSRNLLD